MLNWAIYTRHRVQLKLMQWHHLCRFTIVNYTIGWKSIRWETGEENTRSCWWHQMNSQGNYQIHPDSSSGDLESTACWGRSPSGRLASQTEESIVVPPDCSSGFKTPQLIFLTPPSFFYLGFFCVYRGTTSISFCNLVFLNDNSLEFLYRLLSLAFKG